jgi:hypothetical protein
MGLDIWLLLLRVVVGEAEIHIFIIIFKRVLSFIDEAVIAQVCNQF